LEKGTKRFAEYDGWRSFQYNFCNSARSAGITKKEEIPVAYFNIEDDWYGLLLYIDSINVYMYACDV